MSLKRKTETDEANEKLKQHKVENSKDEKEEKEKDDDNDDNDEEDDDDCDSDGEFINRCVKCRVDMGRDNPRQLCGKTECHGYGYVDDDEK